MGIISTIIPIKHTIPTIYSYTLVTTSFYQFKQINLQILFCSKCCLVICLCVLYCKTGSFHFEGFPKLVRLSVLFCWKLSSSLAQS